MVVSLLCGFGGGLDGVGFGCVDDLGDELGVVLCGGYGCFDDVAVV